MQLLVFPLLWISALLKTERGVLINGSLSRCYKGGICFLKNKSIDFSLFMKGIFKVFTSAKNTVRVGYLEGARCRQCWDLLKVHNRQWQLGPFEGHERLRGGAEGSWWGRAHKEHCRWWGCWIVPNTKVMAGASRVAIPGTMGYSNKMFFSWWG